MNPELLEKVLSCRTLPSLPAVAARVLELTANPNASMREIAATVTNDVALASKVLKTVNSSFYGLSKPCSSINQAIVMLGLSAVKTLALGFSLVSSMAKVKGDGFDLQAHWRRSIVSGIAAKCIAADSRLGCDEECFLGGLLQDVGVVALYVSLGRDYGRVLTMAGREHFALSRLELEELDISHADVGAMIATRWRLPEQLVMPIKYHERPTAAPLEHRTIVNCVAVGTMVANVIGSVEPGPALKRLYAKAEQWMGLRPAQCDEALRKTAMSARDMGRLFDVDTGSMPNTDELLRRASEQLRTMFGPVEWDEKADRLDPMTGLRDRAAMNRAIVAAYEQAAGGGEDLSLVLVSLDQHAALVARGGRCADDAARAIAELLMPLVSRADGVLFSYDGSRFGMVLPGHTRARAIDLAEAARDLVARSAGLVARAIGDEGDIVVSLSAGVATLTAGTRDRIPDAETLVSLTEQALEAARRGGTGELRVFTPRKAA